MKVFVEYQVGVPGEFMCQFKDAIYAAGGIGLMAYGRASAVYTVNYLNITPPVEGDAAAWRSLPTRFGGSAGAPMNPLLAVGTPAGPRRAQ